MSADRYKLIQQVNAARAEAARARRLSGGFTHETYDNLNNYAVELEAKAADLERQANAADPDRASAGSN